MAAPAPRRWLGALRAGRASGREEQGSSFNAPPRSGFLQHAWGGWAQSFRSADDNQASVHNAFAGLEELPAARDGPPRILVLSGNAGAAAVDGDETAERASSAASVNGGVGAGHEPSLGGRSSRPGAGRSAAQRAASQVQSALVVRRLGAARLPGWRRAAARAVWARRSALDLTALSAPLAGARPRARRAAAAAARARRAAQPQPAVAQKRAGAVARGGRTRRRHLGATGSVAARPMAVQHARRARLAGAAGAAGRVEHRGNALRACPALF